MQVLREVALLAHLVAMSERLPEGELTLSSTESDYDSGHLNLNQGSHRLAAYVSRTWSKIWVRLDKASLKRVCELAQKGLEYERQHRSG